MATAGSYNSVFQIETGIVAVMIAASLKRLMQNPSDKNEIESLLNNADVVIGDAKFLGDTALEENMKMIVSLFKEPREKITCLEVSSLLSQFTNLVWG